MRTGSTRPGPRKGPSRQGCSSKRACTVCALAVDKDITAVNATGSHKQTPGNNGRTSVRFRRDDLGRVPCESTRPESRGGAAGIGFRNQQVAFGEGPRRTCCRGLVFFLLFAFLAVMAGINCSSRVRCWGTCRPAAARRRQQWSLGNLDPPSWYFFNFAFRIAAVVPTRSASYIYPNNFRF